MRLVCAYKSRDDSAIRWDALIASLVIERWDSGVGVGVQVYLGRFLLVYIFGVM